MEHNDEFLQSSCLVDVRLKTLDKTFTSYKAVLALNSRYFEAMFTRGFKEAKLSEIELPFIKGETMEEILRGIYRQPVRLTLENVQSLAEAFEYFEINYGSHECHKFATHVLSPNTFKYFKGTAALDKIVNRYIRREIDQIIVMEKVCDMTQTQFKKILESNRTNCHESDLVISLLSWLGSKYTDDVSDITITVEDVVALFDCVRWSLVPREMLQTFYHDFHQLDIFLPLTNSCDLHDLATNVKEAIRQTASELLDSVSLPLQPMSPRAVQPYYVLVAGKKIEDAMHNDHRGENLETLADTFNLVSSDFTASVYSLTSCPFAKSHLQVASVNGFVYLIGGCTTICQRGASATNTVCRYDTLRDQWWQAAPMRNCRAYFACGVMNDSIYVAGGERKKEANQKLEIYNVRLNSWRLGPDLPNPVSGLAGGVVAGAFVVCGGWQTNIDGIGNDAYLYRPKDRKWTTVASMKHGRAFHTCCVHNDKLYAFGGVDEKKQPATRPEVYDSSTNQWKELADMKNSHNEGCAMVFGDNIWVVGGYDHLNLGQTSVSCYSIATDSWSTHYWGTPYAGAAACVVNISLPSLRPPISSVADITMLEPDEVIDDLDHNMM